MNNQDEVDFVFVTTNEVHELIPCLETLFSNPPQCLGKVLVVDNASSDDPDNKLRDFPDVKVLRRETKHGLPANLNYGVRFSSAPYVLLCNPDLLFRPGAVDALVHFAEETPRAGLIAPKLVAPDGSLRLSCRTFYNLPLLLTLRVPFGRRTRMVKEHLLAEWNHAEPRPVDWTACACALVRRTALEQVGGMDERFRLYFDDVDVAFRLWEKGWEVWYVPAAEVVHLEERASARPLSRAWRTHLASLVKFLLKHRAFAPAMKLVWTNKTQSID